MSEEVLLLNVAPLARSRSSGVEFDASVGSIHLIVDSSEGSMARYMLESLFPVIVHLSARVSIADREVLVTECFSLDRELLQQLKHK